METIQVVLDSKLLQATDRAARRTKQSRSALIRVALREHLRRPMPPDDSLLWEEEAAWPSG